MNGAVAYQTSLQQSHRLVNNVHFRSATADLGKPVRVSIIQARQGLGGAETRDPVQLTAGLIVAVVILTQHVALQAFAGQWVDASSLACTK